MSKVHEIEQIDAAHKRMEVPGGWIYLIYDYRCIRVGNNNDRGTGELSWEYVLVSSVFVPKVK